MTEPSATPWNFPSTPKPNMWAARGISVEETDLRLMSVQRRIPVTRVADLTPLDYLRLPVYTAVTPFARDLTTHLGKGDDAISARVSALMEAVERVSAEDVRPGTTRRASFEELRSAGAVDPLNFDLPADTSYSSATAFDWVEGFDLAEGHSVLLPTDLVISPPGQGILRHVDTNGLASGNTMLEAVVHAICEVIERDSLSQHEFRILFGDAHDRRPPCTAIKLDTITGPAQRWIERVREHDLELVVQDITGDIEAPTFRAFLIDLTFPTALGAIAVCFPGFGTHPNTELAVLRAVTEAIQSRLGAIQGARDAFNLSPSPRRRAAQLERAREISSAPARSFAGTPSRLYVDLRDDLRFLLDSLQRAGFGQVIAVDLTRADLELPVVRVRVPGLSAFFVNRRRVGHRVLRYLV